MLTYPVDAVIDNSRTDFDLYIEAGERMTLYAKSGYHWAKDELSRLLGNGHLLFYYFSGDQSKVDTYKLVHQTIKIDTTSPPNQRILNLTEAAAELTRVLYTHPLTDAAFDMGKQIASAMVVCVEEDHSCIAAIGLLAHHDYYTYYHSARVAAYSLAIAMHLNQRDSAVLQEMAIGALFHDVGKSKVDLAVLNKRGAFTDKDWDAMKQHPVFGHQIVSASTLALLPREIILHHHERLDGSGYPHNLTDHELLEEVKIAAFADVYDALTTNRPYQVSRSRFEALDFIKHRLLKNMHKDSYEALVALLGAKKI